MLAHPCLCLCLPTLILENDSNKVLHVKIEHMSGCRGYLLHLNCGTNWPCLSWHEKSSNCFCIIMKMAVKPVYSYTYHAKKNLPCSAPHRIFDTYITNGWYYFSTILKHIIPWSKPCTSSNLKKWQLVQYMKGSMLQGKVVVFANALTTQL